MDALRMREKLTEAREKLSVLRELFASADSELDACKDGLHTIVDEAISTLEEVQAELASEWKGATE